MPLFRDGAFTDDPWIIVPNDAEIPPEGHVVVSRERLLAGGAQIRERSGGLGLVLRAGEKLDGLEHVLSELSLVILHIGRYADGRHFSTARLLRDRYGYTGELRAAGDVLQDQIVFLLRTGFDSLDVSHPATVAALQENRLVAVRHHYQSGWSGARDVPAGTRPWQRRSA